MAAISECNCTLSILLAILIAGYKYEVNAVSPGTLSASVICDNMPGLSSTQKTFCKTRPGAMVTVGRGAKSAAEECQRQFRTSRWNCSLGEGTTSLELGNNLPLGSRETGFAISIKSAGIAHSIVQSCSLGVLDGCECDNTDLKRESSVIDWTWGGCSATIEYGIYFAEIFLDAAENGDTPRSLMNLHNSRAGRKVLKRRAKTNCKCHGSSGSCALKTCWQSLPDLRSVGKSLKNRYYKAKKVLPVQLQRRERTSFMLYRAKRASKNMVPRKADLVFLEESPNYCDYNKRLGSMGTFGRLCNKTISSDLDSCDILCCGRGYNTLEKTLAKKCDCVFHWCCHVTCSKCEKTVNIYTCR